MIDFLKKTFHIPKFAHGGITEKPIVDAECDPPEFVVNQERFDELMEELRFTDIVQVVRCKECKFRHSSEFCECRPEDGFCNDGERRSQ